MSVHPVIFNVLSSVLAQTDGADARASALGGKSLLEYIQASGFVGYVLIIVSIVALALTIASILQLQRGKMAPIDSIESLDKMIGEGRVQEAMTYCESESHQSSLTRILGSALNRCRRSQFGFLEMRAAVEEAGQRELERVSRPIDTIGLIAAVGPMLGLLGTVIAMIGAFGTIGGLEGAARSQKLATFMAMALVATALGLIVAIPCTILYNLLRRRAEALLSELGEVLDQWVGTLERLGDSGGAAQPGGAAVAARRRVPAAQPQPQPMPVGGGGAGGTGVRRTSGTSGGVS
jgi:biopolymer transport protein ExbB